MMDDGYGRPEGVSHIQTDRFHGSGHLGPIRVLTQQETRRFLDATVYGHPIPPLDWPKGHAASSRTFYEISTHPAIIEVVAELLGDDIMLWGASIATRGPGVVHPWHCDIESSDPSSRTVSVWIGLEGTSRDSSLRIVPYSHRFGETIQEVRYRLGEARDETSDDAVLGWARQRDPRAEVLSPEMTDGDALFFDGKLWHGSDNVSGRTRHALLLQYAPPNDPIHIPDLAFLDWPFKLLEAPRPPCLLLRGRDPARVNRIVPAPMAGGAEQERPLNSQVHPIQVPLSPSDKGWQIHPIFHGRTADVETLTCHASTLPREQSPHPPHTHIEEELLVLLMGEVELLLPDGPDPTSPGTTRLKPGGFVYYPTGFAHSLKAVSREPANYVMFKWHTDSTEIDDGLPFGQFGAFEQRPASGVEPGFQARLVFEGPTEYLRKLHCHVTTLAPGEGYEPHVDAYDVAIVVLEGELETLEERVGPYSVIFYRAGDAHGMRNPGDATATYLVFEFHGRRRQSEASPRSQGAPSWNTRLKALLPTKLKQFLRRFKERVSR
jgi:quercetin dioxygenase-like cupin family protein